MKTLRMRLIAVTTGTLMLAGLGAVAADGIQLGTVAHQAIHRTEKLAQVGQLDEGFVTNLESVTLTKLAPPQNGAVFQVTLRQVAGADGTSEAAVLFFDPHGRNISHTVVKGASSVNAPAWPDAKAVTLAEDAFHFLIAQVDTRPELSPFLNDFQSETLTQQTTAAGEVVAQVDFKSSSTPATLRLIESTAGDVASGTVIP